MEKKCIPLILSMVVVVVVAVVVFLIYKINAIQPSANIHSGARERTHTHWMWNGLNFDVFRHTDEHRVKTLTHKRRKAVAEIKIRRMKNTTNNNSPCIFRLLGANNFMGLSCHD